MHDAEKFAGSTSGESLTEEELVLAQIAQEKGREVKYRTCSWQKVQNSPLLPASLTNSSDRCSFIFRIYLPRDLIVSLVSPAATKPNAETG